MQKNNINTFQYLSLVRYKGLVSILKKYEKQNISIILDLEDSAQDLFSEKRTEELKSIGRKGIIYLAEKDLKLKNDIFIRINNIKSKDHSKDLLMIKEGIKKGLKVMDTTAFTLSQENKLPIIVFDMNTPGNLMNVIKGKNIGTRVNL